MGFEQVVGCERLAAVVLRIEDPERLIDVVGHDTDKLATIADEGQQLQLPVVPEALRRRWSSVQTRETGLSPPGGTDIAIVGVEDRHDHPQRQEPLLSIDHIQSVAVPVEDDRAEHIGAPLRSGSLKASLTSPSNWSAVSGSQL